MSIFVICTKFRLYKNINIYPPLFFLFYNLLAVAVYRYLLRSYAILRSVSSVPDLDPFDVF